MDAKDRPEVVCEVGSKHSVGPNHSSSFFTVCPSVFLDRFLCGLPLSFTAACLARADLVQHQFINRLSGPHDKVKRAATHHYLRRRSFYDESGGFCSSVPAVYFA
jgi:hypothetical protein